MLPQSEPRAGVWLPRDATTCQSGMTSLFVGVKYLEWLTQCSGTAEWYSGVLQWFTPPANGTRPATCGGSSGRSRGGSLMDSRTPKGQNATSRHMMMAMLTCVMLASGSGRIFRPRCLLYSNRSCVQWPALPQRLVDVLMTPESVPPASRKDPASASRFSIFAREHPQGAFPNGHLGYHHDP